MPVISASCEIRNPIVTSINFAMIKVRINEYATSLGAASGVVAGLVAITPACSSVDPLGAIAVGAISSVLSSLAVGLKYKFGYDDSLDVVGVHLVGGLSGSLLVGVFATAAAPAGVDGLLYGGGSGQLVKQVIACGALHKGRNIHGRPQAKMPKR